jgi:hypothetical protein
MSLTIISDYVKSTIEKYNNTLLYISIGSAERSKENGGGGDKKICYNTNNQNDSTIRAYNQQLPLFIKNYISNNPTHKVLTIIIDQILNDRPLIIDETYINEKIAPKTILYTSKDYNSPLTAITIENTVRWENPRHDIDKTLIDIRDFVKDIVETCNIYNTCLIMESFTGQSLSSLRKFIEDEYELSDNYDEILDRFLIGLTINANNCYPDLNSEEYNIKIHYEKNKGIFIDNPHKFINPDIFKKVLTKSIICDKSLAIRMSKILNMKAEILCDSILTLARMSLLRSENKMNVKNDIYKSYIDFTSKNYKVDIIDDIDCIFLVLIDKLNELQKYSLVNTKINKANIDNFRENKNYYQNYNNLFKQIMNDFPVIEFQNE